jgi:hypothetical protein
VWRKRGRRRRARHPRVREDVGRLEAWRMDDRDEDDRWRVRGVACCGWADGPEMRVLLTQAALPNQPQDAHA